MKSSWTFGGIVAAVVGLVMVATPARVVADECQQACSAVASTAVSEGKAALKSCRLQCRNGDRGACRASCRASTKQARSATKTAHVQCSQTCRPANSCEEQCLVPARQCLAPILAQAKSCTHSCGDSAAAAMADCSSASDPFACLDAASHQLYVCAQGCATSTRDSAEACKSALDACKGTCAPANPCAGQCAPALQGCLGPIVQHAGVCGEQCLASAHDAGAACLNGPDPAACLAQVAQQLTQCTLGCKTTAEQGARDCQTTFEGCVHDCLPPDPCRDECYGTLQECVAPIAADAQACDAQCTADALAAATACLNAENPTACLLEVEQTLGTCLHGCASVVRTRAEGCWGDFRQCGDTCTHPANDTCRGGCLAAAGQCIGPVVDHTKGCVQTCANNVVQQAPACAAQPAPMVCLNGVAQQFLQCAQACRPDAEAGAAACRTALDSCVQSCPADPCRDGCVGSLESCAQSLAGQAETCAAGCVTSTLNAGAACARQPNPLLCLREVAQQGWQGGAGCEAAAHTSAAACASSYQACTQGCGA